MIRRVVSAIDATPQDLQRGETVIQNHFVELRCVLIHVLILDRVWSPSIFALLKHPRHEKMAELQVVESSTTFTS